MKATTPNKAPMPRAGGPAGAHTGVATGVLVLADGTAFAGHGAGAVGAAVGELCFNTAMTGYQEILTDPSYAEQIICFTFPHVGNVGTTPEDDEALTAPARRAARGAVLRAPITLPANWRSKGEADGHLDGWLAQRGVVAVTGVDTRALTRRIREQGMPHAIVAHDPNGAFDIPALAEQARAWSGLEGADLAKDVDTESPFAIAEQAWSWPDGVVPVEPARFRVVMLDYGLKANIARRLGSIGASVQVLPGDSTAADVLALAPDGIMLANGPGDPAATGAYACREIKRLAGSGTPLFAICLGHQMLAIALGGRTKKMAQGHHGANHPVKELATGEVQIVSMNHGFTVDRDSLPANVEETHVSLFDGTNCGLRMTDRPVFSVQHHPEASPGPHDSFGLFERFAQLMTERRASTSASPRSTRAKAKSAKTKAAKPKAAQSGARSGTKGGAKRKRAKARA